MLLFFSSTVVGGNNNDSLRRQLVSILIYMKMKTVTMTVLAIMLAVSAFADQQADMINYLKQAGPDADFSQKSHEDIDMLGEADAMIYFAEHHFSPDDSLKIGKAHAYRHHLIGAEATNYAVSFYIAIQALTQKE
jgi:hypothetical protein